MLVGMHWRADLTIHTAAPVTDAVLEAVTRIGGYATGGSPGGRPVLAATALFVQAPTIVEAAAKALEVITRIAPGEPIAIEVMTAEEAERRFDRPRGAPQ
jgi:hypothetical protein